MALAACRPAPEAKAARAWEVTSPRGVVFIFFDKPGAVLSTASPAPDFKPPAYDFVSGYFRDSEEEHKIGLLLRQARTLKQFVSLLQYNGYRVQEIQGRSG